MMSNTSYNELFNLDFKMFKKLVYEQDIDIDEEQLLLIYNLIQNNRYALIDSHYNEVLYNYISEKKVSLLDLKLKVFYPIVPITLI